MQSPERFDLPESKRATLRKEPTPRASVAATILSTAQRFCVYGKCGSCSCRPGSLIRTVNSKQVNRRMGEGAKNQPNLFDLGFLNVMNAKTPRRANPVLAGKGATAKRRRRDARGNGDTDPHEERGERKPQGDDPQVVTTEEARAIKYARSWTERQRGFGWLGRRNTVRLFKHLYRMYIFTQQPQCCRTRRKQMRRATSEPY